MMRKHGVENINEHFISFNTICDATQVIIACPLPFLCRVGFCVWVYGISLILPEGATLLHNYICAPYLLHNCNAWILCFL